MAKQSCLEKKAIENRQTELVRNDYHRDEEYSSLHKDALSDGDAQGKGTGHGGHGFWLPDCSRGQTEINYSNFDTENGGGKYDIEGRNGVGGRNFLTTICLYNKNNPYGANSIDTSANIADGQIVI